MTNKTILAKPGAARVWFCIFFAGTALVAYSIILLRQDAATLGPLRIFPRLFLIEDYLGAWLLLGTVLLGLVPSLQSAGLRLVRGLGDHPVVAALFTTLVLAFGARFGYLAHPLSMDEYAPVFQSHALAAGHLCGQFPPALIDWLVPGEFQNVFLVVSHETGCVASAYWPGFALLLAPFSALGVPWLCNPVLGGLTVLVLHRLALDIFIDRTAAGFVALLTLASTAFTINAISFYSMPAHLLFNALFALCLLRKQVVHAFLAGMVGGWALVLHNPFPHALFAAPWVVWLLLQKNRFSLLAALLAGYAPFALGGLLWIQFLQDVKGTSMATSSVAAATDSATSALQSLWESATRIFQFPSSNVFAARAIGVAKLWLWASPGLVALAAWGLWKRRTDARFILLGASALMTLIGYLFYPADQGHGWGFRYFHSAWLALPLLATALMVGSDRERPETHHEDVRALVAGCALAALILMTLLRVQQTHQFVSRHLAQLPSAPEGQQPALQIADISIGYYPADLVQNDPFLRNATLRMMSHGAQVDSLMVAEFFPGMRKLSDGRRGSTWGYSTSPGVGTDEHRQQE